MQQPQTQQIQQYNYMYPSTTGPTSQVSPIANVSFETITMSNWKYDKPCEEPCFAVSFGYASNSKELVTKKLVNLVGESCNPSLYNHYTGLYSKDFKPCSSTLSTENFLNLLQSKLIGDCFDSNTRAITKVPKLSDIYLFRHIWSKIVDSNKIDLKLRLVKDPLVVTTDINAKSFITQRFIDLNSLYCYAITEFLNLFAGDIMQFINHPVLGKTLKGDDAAKDFELRKRLCEVASEAYDNLLDNWDRLVLPTKNIIEAEAIVKVDTIRKFNIPEFAVRWIRLLVQEHNIDIIYERNVNDDLVNSVKKTLHDACLVTFVQQIQQLNVNGYGEKDIIYAIYKFVDKDLTTLTTDVLKKSFGEKEQMPSSISQLVERIQSIVNAKEAIEQAKINKITQSGKFTTRPTNLMSTFQYGGQQQQQQMMGQQQSPFQQPQQQSAFGQTFGGQPQQQSAFGQMNVSQQPMMPVANPFAQPMQTTFAFQPQQQVQQAPAILCDPSDLWIARVQEYIQSGDATLLESIKKDINNPSDGQGIRTFAMQWAKEEAGLVDPHIVDLSAFDFNSLAFEVKIIYFARHFRSILRSVKVSRNGVESELDVSECLDNNFKLTDVLKNIVKGQGNEVKVLDKQTVLQKLVNAAKAALKTK
jgi:hypothetical protein